MTELNFKAHNAKNNYMYISYYFDEDVARNILNKVDLFVIGSRIFCQKFARKDKSFKFNFYEKTYCDLGTTTYENAPIAWNHCDHCAKFVFFRSTLKFQTIMASIEFVKTLFDFVSNEKITYDGLYEDFRSVFERYINFACKHSLYFEEYLKTKFDLKIIKEYV